MIYKIEQSKCIHLNISKEVYCGTKTGDYICNDCGLVYSQKSFFEIDRDQKKGD